MALPTAYLTTQKNLAAILDAIKNAQAPKQFTRRFLDGLGFKGSSDRLIIGVLKALGFLDDKGQPTQRYFRYLDASQSKKILAEGIREAYADLFEINVNANTLSRNDLINKMKTLSQGQLTDSVLDKMALTFKALSSLADFSEPASAGVVEDQESTSGVVSDAGTTPQDPLSRLNPKDEMKLGLVYNIQLVLPESRDPAVYDAFFQSFRKHMLR